MDLELGKRYDVEVIKIIKVGAIVKLSDSSTELIHVSNISDSFVSDVRQFVSVRDTMEAECIIGADGRLQLSIKHLNLHPTTESAPATTQYVSRPRYIRPVKVQEGVVKDKGTPDLERMIADSNKSFEDKFKGSRNSIRRPPMSSKKHKRNY